MAYEVPTPQQLQIYFPKFAGVSLTQIQISIMNAQQVVDDTWDAGDYAQAIMLYACHDMTLNGLGDGTEAQLLGEGVDDFQTIRLGNLNLSRFNRQPSGGKADVWQKTSYGQRFAEIAERNAGGPLVTGKSPLQAEGAVVGVPGLGLGWLTGEW